MGGMSLILFVFTSENMMLEIELQELRRQKIPNTDSLVQVVTCSGNLVNLFVPK